MNFLKIEREGKKKRIDRVNFLKIEREGKKKELIDEWTFWKLNRKEKKRIDRRVDFLKILKNRDVFDICLCFYEYLRGNVKNVFFLFFFFFFEDTQSVY